MAGVDRDDWARVTDEDRKKLDKGYGVIKHDPDGSGAVVILPDVYRQADIDLIKGFFDDLVTKYQQMGYDATTFRRITDVIIADHQSKLVSD